MTKGQNDGSREADGLHAVPSSTANTVLQGSPLIVSAGPDDFSTAEHEVVATLFDWSKLHGLTLGAISDCLATFGGNGSLFELAELQAPEECNNLPHSQLEGECVTTALHAFVCPALAALFDDYDLVPLIAAIEWRTMEEAEMARPHTVYHGVNRPPEIRMSWRGSVSDLVCLVHEVAHAVQLQLSAGSFMPPVAREACAFIGELALIDWAKRNQTELAAKLLRVWREENLRYFGDDCDLLSSALADPEAAYSYRMNYPLARASAVVMWRSGANLQQLFSAGSEAMAFLPLARIADVAGLTPNYLPPLPPPDTEQPAIDAYRALGAMALLDIDFWKGESERRIEDYYATLLHHLQNSTAFVALDEVRRPVGYATWRKAAGDNTVTLARQAAPFGDHLLLQKALECHLCQKSDVHAQHPRSARQEQVAW